MSIEAGLHAGRRGSLAAARNRLALPMRSYTQPNTTLTSAVQLEHLSTSSSSFSSATLAAIARSSRHARHSARSHLPLSATNRSGSHCTCLALSTDPSPHLATVSTLPPQHLVDCASELRSAPPVPAEEVQQPRVCVQYTHFGSVDTRLVAVVARLIAVAIE